MFEPIIAQLQQKLYQSVLSNLYEVFGQKQSSAANNGANFTARQSEFDMLLETAAQKHGVDAGLLKAVAQAESNFSATAVSHAGAKGLMQLTDATAQMLGVTDVFDPVQNIDGGARYLKQLLTRYNGDPSLALAAYNAGPGTVDRWGGLPPYSETQAYVPRVLDLRNQYNSWLA